MFHKILFPFMLKFAAKIRWEICQDLSDFKHLKLFRNLTNLPRGGVHGDGFILGKKWPQKGSPKAPKLAEFCFS